MLDTGRSGAGRAKATVTGGGARNVSAVDGSRAFGYVPLARVRRWTFLVTNSDDERSGEPVTHNLVSSLEL